MKCFFKKTDIKNIVANNIKIFENMAYLSVFQILTMLFPLITYPYLIRVLGKDVYGIVILAQILVAYVSLVVNYGFQVVTVRHIARYRNNISKISEVFSSVFFFQLFLAFTCFIVYCLIVLLIDEFNQYKFLFIISYGLIFNELLFPQYLFLGLEKMKYITLVNVVIRVISVFLLFVLVHTENDYYYVPLCHFCGYLIAGFYTFYIILHKEKIRVYLPPINTILIYVKDATPLFLTNIIGSIKDKWNYFMIGAFVGLGEVAIYDFCMRLMAFLDKPVNIISTVLFPKISREKNIKTFKKAIWLTTSLMAVLVLMLNIFLPWITRFVIGEEVNLLPIRIFLIIPIILTYSVFCANNLIIGFGYNIKVLTSIIITTIAYLIFLGIFYWFNCLDKIIYFILISLFAYVVEFLYRYFVSRKIIRIEENK